MHGLLAEVLRYQHATGGSAILLSATLPSSVRDTLLQAWRGRGEGLAESAPYPVVWQTNGKELTALEVAPEHQPKERVVSVECVKCHDALPDAALMERIVAAGDQGLDNAQASSWTTRALQQVIVRHALHEVLRGLDGARIGGWHRNAKRACANCSRFPAGADTP